MQRFVVLRHKNPFSRPYYELFVQLTRSCSTIPTSEGEKSLPKRRVRVVVRRENLEPTPIVETEQGLAPQAQPQHQEQKLVSAPKVTMLNQPAPTPTPNPKRPLSAFNMTKLSDQTLENLWATFTPAAPATALPSANINKNNSNNNNRNLNHCLDDFVVGDDDDRTEIGSLYEKSSDTPNQKNRAFFARRGNKNNSTSSSKDKGPSSSSCTLNKISREISKMTHELSERVNHKSPHENMKKLIQKEMFSRYDNRNYERQKNDRFSGCSPNSTAFPPSSSSPRPRLRTPPTTTAIQDQTQTQQKSAKNCFGQSFSPQHFSPSKELKKESHSSSSSSLLSSSSTSSHNQKKDAVDALLEDIIVKEQRKSLLQQQQQHHSCNKLENEDNGDGDDNDDDDGWTIIPNNDTSFSSSSPSLPPSLNRTTIIDDDSRFGDDEFMSHQPMIIPAHKSSKRSFASSSPFAATRIQLQQQQQHPRMSFRRIDNNQRSLSGIAGRRGSGGGNAFGGGGRQRSDEWHLGSIIDKIFAELSTDGRRLPVTRCISYLFDNNANACPVAAIAFANPAQLSSRQEVQVEQESSISSSSSSSATKSSASPFASFTTKQLADFFDPSKPLSFVPSPVKKEVRARFQQKGGLLKFVEQHLSSRYTIGKDPVTSELAITVCAYDTFSASFGEQQRKAEDDSACESSSSSPSSPSPGGDIKPWNASPLATTNKPWSTSQQRLQVELSWVERVPVDKGQAETFLDMMAAGCRPIYGDEWTYLGNINFDHQYFSGRRGERRGEQHSSSSSSSSMPIQQRVFRTAEVADIFVEHTPTFWVRERQLARALAERCGDVLEESGFARMEDFFERYPRIFEIYFEGDPRAREVRLNPSFNKNHPRRGMADKVWELRASPRAEDELLQAQDRLFGRILLENLSPSSSSPSSPAYSAAAAGEGLFVFLPEWIRKSFSEKDRATINSAPPQRTLYILSKYAKLFEIRHHEADGEPPKIQQRRFSSDDGDSCSRLPHRHDGDNKDGNPESEDGRRKGDDLDPLVREYSHVPSEFRIWVRRRPAHLAPGCLDEHDTDTSPAPLLAKFLLETVMDLEREKRRELEERMNASSSNSSSSSSSSSLSSLSPQSSQKQNLSPFSAGADEKRKDGAAGEGSSTFSAEVVVVDDDYYGGSGTKHEINIQLLYSKLAPEHRQMLKPFSTLAKFLRIHGQIFAVSSDMQRVSLHRWDGAAQAFATIDSLLAEEEKTSSFIPDNHAPTFTPRTRKQLSHVDPNNPFLNRAYLQQAIHDVLPERSAVLVKDLFKRLLPRDASAALPTRNPYSILMSTPLLTVWKAHNNFEDGKRCLLIQRGELGPPPKGCGLEDCASKEEIIAQIQELLATMGPTMSIRALHEKLRWDAIVGIKQHFKTVDVCVRSYPQLFEVTMPEDAFGESVADVGAWSCLVSLVRRR